MKYCLITLVFALCCTKIKAQNIHHSKKRDEKWAMARIAALPEVKDFMRYAKKDDPMLEMKHDPDSTTKYYCIAVGIGNFDMFRTTVDYFIDPKTNRVYINDVMDNSNDDLYHIISLEKYRHWRNDPRFQHYHTFKGDKIIPLDINRKVIMGAKK